MKFKYLVEASATDPYQLDDIRKMSVDKLAEYIMNSASDTTTNVRLREAIDLYVKKKFPNITNYRAISAIQNIINEDQTFFTKLSIMQYLSEMNDKHEDDAAKITGDTINLVNYALSETSLNVNNPALYKEWLYSENEKANVYKLRALIILSSKSYRKRYHFPDWLTPEFVSTNKLTDTAQKLHDVLDQNSSESEDTFEDFLKDNKIDLKGDLKTAVAKLVELYKKTFNDIGEIGGLPADIKSFDDLESKILEFFNSTDQTVAKKRARILKSENNNTNDATTLLTLLSMIFGTNDTTTNSANGNANNTGRKSRPFDGTIAELCEQKHIGDKQLEKYIIDQLDKRFRDPDVMTYLGKHVHDIFNTETNGEDWLNKFKDTHVKGGVTSKTFLEEVVRFLDNDLGYSAEDTKHADIIKKAMPRDSRLKHASIKGKRVTDTEIPEIIRRVHINIMNMVNDKEPNYRKINNYLLELLKTYAGRYVDEPHLMNFALKALRDKFGIRIG